jgi:4-amino-4-deoxy-L-arabinose transferase-like glycosyltransferase
MMMKASIGVEPAQTEIGQKDGALERVTARGTSWLPSLDAGAAAFFRFLAFRPYAGTLALFLLCCALYLPGISTLPVTDRDEARFTQASKQMVESGNYIDIRFQDVPRYKKPIGIYWLQAASVAALTKAGAALNDIWPYRIPSFLAALGAVLLTFWSMRPLIGREPALIGAALFASCLSLTFEAHIAKSDAALICSIALMQGTLFRLYLAPRGAPTRGIAALFWLAVGASILIKGPVGPALAILTAATVAFRDKNRTWLNNLHWRWGVPLLLLVTLPWFIAIGISSGGEFFRSSLGQDFAGKLQGGQESHWGPPGLYFLLFWWTFWSAVIFVTAGAALSLWRGRHGRRALFLLAWIVPYWLMIEAIPTKLPHYSLPIYPAIAVAAAFLLRMPCAGGHAATPESAPPGAILWIVVAGLQAAFLVAVSWIFEATNTIALAVLLAAFATLAGLAALSAWRSYRNATLAAAVLASAVFYTAAFGVVLPGLEPIWISKKAASAAHALATCGAEPAAFAGFSEPSAIFLTGTRTVITSATGAAQTMASGKLSLAFVNWSQRAEFEQEFAQKAGSPPRFLGCVDGVNINGRGPTRLQIYARPGTENRNGCAPMPQIRCTDQGEVRWRRLLNAKY